jgi:hypothetical protein
MTFTFYVTVLYAAVTPVAVITCAFYEVEGEKGHLTPRVDKQVGSGIENAH